MYKQAKMTLTNASWHSLNIDSLMHVPENTKRGRKFTELSCNSFPDSWLKHEPSPILSPGRLAKKNSPGMQETACNAGDMGLNPGSGRFPQRRKWHPTPVLLPGKSHGRRSVVGYSPWGCKESDTTEPFHLLLFPFIKHLLYSGSLLNITPCVASFMSHNSLIMNVVLCRLTGGETEAQRCYKCCQQSHS